MHQESTTAMIRYECDVCDMVATCVVTEATSLAWLDHMDTHERTATYHAWSWEVVPLLFEPVGE